MTGHARRDAGAALGVAAALVVDAVRERPAFDRGALLPDDHAGKRVATETSRGDIAAVVVPGFALGKRRTTAPGIVAEEPAAAWPVPACGAPAWPGFVRACPAAAVAIAAPVEGATLRITDDEAGLTVAVVRSSRLVAAARRSAGPGAAEAVGSSPDPVRASGLIDARASPATGAYDGEPRLPAGAVEVASLVAVAALSVAPLEDAAAAAGRVAAGCAVDPTDLDGDPVSARCAAAAAAGIRRTTEGSAVAAARVAADIAAIDGADGNARRAVAAATVRAGPVTDRKSVV